MTGIAGAPVTLVTWIFLEEPFMSDLVHSLSDADFAGAVAAGVSLVDFWAPWCAPCREVSPRVDQAAETFKGKVAFYRVNVDDNPKTSEAYDILSMPTLLLMKDGKPMDKVIGTRSRPEIEAFVQRAL